MISFYKLYEYLNNKDYIVYCDLDGVLVDLERGVREKLNIEQPLGRLGIMKGLAQIKKNGDDLVEFFGSLPWTADGERLWNFIKKYDATSQTGETIRVDSGIKYNPGTDTLTVPTIKTGTINASDGSSAITINDVSGNVSVASSLTVTGDLTVLGSQTIVNTTELKVEDNLIDLGLVNSGGSLVPPSVDANIDIGVLFNYYTTSAKKSGIFWDDSTGRIGIASDLTVTNGVVDTISTVWAPIEIGALWVNDCAGQSQVINCSSGIRTLENITVDGGAF